MLTVNNPYGIPQCPYTNLQHHHLYQFYKVRVPTSRTKVLAQKMIISSPGSHFTHNIFVNPPVVLISI